MPDSRLQFRGKEVNGMFKRIHSNEGGFTLVELLVTISILAVLFGIVALGLAGVGSNAEVEVQKAELGIVQSAVDIYMADQNLSSLVDDRTVAAKIVEGDIIDDAPFATYLRHLPTTYCYTWDTDGEVAQPPCP